MTPATVWLIEDDDALADALQLLLSSHGHGCERFAGGEAFLATLARRPHWRQTPACIVCAVRLGRMSRIELFAWLARHEAGHPWPVIFMTGHGDIQMAVEALKNGAFDFFEKPFDHQRLLVRIGQALLESAQRVASADAQAAVLQRLERLSQRERDVMDLILQGLLNKLIAAQLGISMRTVEVHRANLFDKMQVRSAVELATLLGRSPR